MALNLNDLQIFVQVVDHGGFAAASRALNVPKQTLSKRLAELERRAGVRLVQRTSRSFAVTELGRDLYLHASAMVIEAEAAESVILRGLAEPTGSVRITGSVPTVQHSLAPILPRIAKAYPKIRIILNASDRLVDVVQEGYDIAVRDHFTPLPNSDLVQRRIGTEPFWLVASPQLFSGERPPSHPHEIDGLGGLFADQTESGWTLHGPGDISAYVALQPRYYANEASGLLAAAEVGLGIASLPSTMCHSGLAAGRLIRVLPDWKSGTVTTTLLMPHRRGQLPSVRVVADLLIEELRGYRRTS